LLDLQSGGELRLGRSFLLGQTHEQSRACQREDAGFHALIKKRAKLTVYPGKTFVPLMHEEQCRSAVVPASQGT
jgi:hypothetical protein